MEGVSWSASPHPEAFRRQRTTADTLNRLASFIARAESKQGLSKSCKQLPQQQLQEDAALPFACRECGESFPCGTALLTHQEARHALPKPHRCSRCGQAFSLRSSLQLHNCKVSSQLFQAQTRNSPTYATSLTPSKSADGPAFSQPHISDSSPYACAPCGKGFMLKQALLHHQQAGCDPASPAVDSPLASEEDSSSSSNSLYVPDGQSICKFCSRTFHNEEAYRHHNKIRHSDEQETDSWDSSNEGGQTRASAKAKHGVFSCRSCEMLFSSTAKLSKHRKEKHSRGLNVMTEQQPNIRQRRPTNNTYTCQICSKVFFHHLSLWAHKKKHPTSESGAVSSNRVIASEKGLTPNDATKDWKLIEKPNTENKFGPRKILLRESILTKAVSVAKIFPPKLQKSHKFHASLKAETLKHAEVPKDEDDFDEDETEFPCPSCPEVFSHHSDLKAHTELHQSAVRRSRCSVCTSEMDSLKWPGSKRLRLYHCILCQMGFSTLDPFLSHCQNHLKAKVDEERVTEAPSPRDT